MVTFSKVNMPIKIAAAALKMDAQTVRVLCQMGAAPWGFAFKRPGSKHYSYVISPKAFYESTGFLWKEGLSDESDGV